MKDLTISSGQPGRLVFNLSGGAASLTPVGWIAVTEYPGAKPVATQMQWVAADNALYLPPMPFGCFFYEVRVGALEVAKGHIDVTPSPFPYDGQEYKTWLVTDGDMLNDVATFNIDAAPGIQGPRGASAYELAAAAGYEGTQEDWLAELQGAAAAANEAKVSATEAQRHELLAEEFKYEAGAAKESAEKSAIEAAASATRAAERASDAATCSAAAARGASTAEAEASSAANRAEAAATSASVAQEASAAAQEAAEAAAQEAALLGDAPLCSGNNFFDGTNTFNGAIVANGGINGLTAPAGWGSAVSLLGARFGAFVGECLQRRIATSFAVKSGNGTLASNKLTVAASEQALAYSPLAWKILPVNYSTLGALWMPLRKADYSATGSCRVCLNICCSLRNYTVQEETVDMPIFSYAAANVYSNAHFNVIEFSIEYGSNGQQVVTLLTPIVNENNEMTGMREQRAVVSINNLHNNFIGLLGFLIVRTAANAYEVFAVSEDTCCKIYKCGSVWAQRTLYTGDGPNQQLYIGVTAGSWYLPSELIMEAALPSGVYATMAAQVAAATGTPTVTDYTFDEFNAKYGIE